MKASLIATSFSLALASIHDEVRANVGSNVLPSGWTDVSPSLCPITSTTQVVIYGGHGPTAECKQWEAQFYAWAKLEAVSISAAQLHDSSCGGALKSKGVKIFAMPGGNAYNTQSSVSSAGKANINGFIDAGGLYVGTCAGFYFAATDYWWEGKQYNWPNMLGRVPTVEGSIADIKDDTGSDSYKLTGISNGLKAIYWGGPTRGYQHTSATGFPGTVLAKFSDVRGGSLLAAAHVNDSTHGNLLLFSAHFEAIPGLGIHNTGLTQTQQMANWQYRAQQISAASGLELDLTVSVEVVV